MNYREAQPSPLLAEFIKCFWALEYSPSGPDDEPESVLPDGCPEIVFNLSDRFQRRCPGHEGLQPATILAGQMRRSVLICPTGDVKLFGVRFHPAGAFPIVGFPLSEITDHIVNFADACGTAGREIESKMGEAGSFTERVRIFEGYYLSLVASQGTTDPLARYASGLIVAGKGFDSISRIAERAGVSDRRLERRFKKFVGLSPKTFSRIVRFQNIVNVIQVSGTRNLLDTGLSLGYCDQSHLIRDFNEFSGGSPLAYFDRTHRLSDMFTGAV